MGIPGKKWILNDGTELPDDVREIEGSRYNDFNRQDSAMWDEHRTDKILEAYEEYVRNN